MQICMHMLYFKCGRLFLISISLARLQRKWVHTRNSNSNNNFERFSHLAEPLEANHSSCCCCCCCWSLCCCSCCCYNCASASLLERSWATLLIRSVSPFLFDLNSDSNFNFNLNFHCDCDNHSLLCSAPPRPAHLSPLEHCAAFNINKVKCIHVCHAHSQKQQKVESTFQATVRAWRGIGSVETSRLAKTSRDWRQREWMNEWMNEWMGKRMLQCVTGWLGEWVNNGRKSSDWWNCS